MKSDVVVIGGGIVGAHTAIQLRKRGLSVTLLDPNPPGGAHGASFGNAAWLSSHSVIPPSTPGVWREVPKWLLDPLGPLSVRPTHLVTALPWLVQYLLSGSTPDKIRRTARVLRNLLVDAPRLHAEIAAEAGLSHLIDAGSGLMHIYKDRAGFLKDKLGWDIRREVGIKWKEFEGEDLAKKQPCLSKEYQFGVLVPEAGYCLNPGTYVAGLVRFAEACGVKRIIGRAIDFKQDSGKLAAVISDQGEIHCASAVVATGINSKSLALKAGDKVMLDSERGYHVFAGGEVDGPTIPTMVGDRKVVISAIEGGIRCAGQVELAGLHAAPDWRRSEILRQHLGAVFPDVDVSVCSSWMGHRPSTPDGIPCISKASGIEGVIYAFGHGHIGLVSSPRTARLVAQLVVDEPPEIELSPFSAKRFN